MLIVSAGNPKGKDHPEGEPDRSGQGVSEHFGSVKRQHSDRPEGKSASPLSVPGRERKEREADKEEKETTTIALIKKLLKIEEGEESLSQKVAAGKKEENIVINHCLFLRKENGFHICVLRDFLKIN